MDHSKKVLPQKGNSQESQGAGSVTPDAMAGEMAGAKAGAMKIPNRQKKCSPTDNSLADMIRVSA